MRKHSLLILIGVLNVVVSGQGYAASPVGKFEKRLSELQRHGECVELPQFGVSTHRNRNSDDVNIRLITELGAQIVRIQISWIDTERGGKFDFGEFDNIVRELRQKKKSIVLVLAYGHPDHTDGGWETGFPFVPRTPEQREAYFRYIQAVIEHFHGPDITYQVWNEPNIKLFWPPPDAVAYGKLLEGAAAAIRKIDPTATIISAGIANEQNRDGFLGNMIAATSLDQVNALAFHPYRQEGPENSLLDISEFENVAVKKNGSRPLWLTEWGYSESWFARTYPRDDISRRKAVMTARLMLTAAIAKVKAAIIYDLIDDGPDATNPEFKFGLYDYDFKPKEAAVAFRTLANLMAYCKTYRFEFNPARKVIIATFTSDMHISRIVWTYDATRNQEVCLEPGPSKEINLQDLSGKFVPFGSCRGSLNISVNVSESSGPLILTTGR